jgi:hypothetical protein
LLHVTVLRDLKRHQKCWLRWEATDAVRDNSTGSGLQAWLSRRAEERAAMLCAGIEKRMTPDLLRELIAIVKVMQEEALR